MRHQCLLRAIFCQLGCRLFHFAEPATSSRRGTIEKPVERPATVVLIASAEEVRAAVVVANFGVFRRANTGEDGII